MKNNIMVLLFLLSSSLSSAQWEQTKGPSGVKFLAVSGTNICVATERRLWREGEVFLSTNNGTNWTATGFVKEFQALTISGSNIFAAYYDYDSSGVILLKNNDTSWIGVNCGLMNTYILSLAVSGRNLFAGTTHGLFLSTNDGNTWATLNNGLPDGLIVSSLVVSGTNIFAWDSYGYGYGIYLSTNSGYTWAALNNGFTNFEINSFAVSGSNLFAGTDEGVFLSTKNGTNWTAVNDGLTNLNVHSLALSGTNLFAGTDEGVFLSTKNGTSWENKNQGFNRIPRINDIIISNNYIFAGTGERIVWRRSLEEILK